MISPDLKPSFGKQHFRKVFKKIRKLENQKREEAKNRNIIP